MEQNNCYIIDYFLTAGECDAEGRMPLPLLVGRLIEGASLHANSLNIGYAKLIEINLAWVLSRVSIEIVNMPRVNEPYRLMTWIEGTNRLFSERCFELIDKDGKTAAMARTTWAAIDIATRRPTNPGIFGDMMFPENPKPCRVEPSEKLPIIENEYISKKYTFKYCDLDFNRHVNTIRYVDLILNFWALERYDSKHIVRFDIAFHQECHYGDEVEIRVNECDDISRCDIINNNARSLSARIEWKNN